MNYRDFNDYELLSYIEEGNEEASNVLYKKYEPFIIATAKKMASTCSTLGIDISDFIQEGMLGFSQAIRKFDERRDIQFYTLAKKCVESKMLSLIFTAKRQKHRILNESLSIESETDEFTLEKVLGDNSRNPEHIVLDKQQQEEILSLVKSHLTEYEKKVFELKYIGFDYKEIASLLDKSPKSIDNTIQRMKTKAKECIEQQK